ncbi:hypothetical protein [Pseudomonas sp. B5(2017)]|uniref:hypothetical protein n=1 Tax=Pseudomonas sp. B5(2017) TaxID=1981714 RepID=UPI00111C4664|nr:hypothetical protein [Pseudomonas sp. B5(2017)]
MHSYELTPTQIVFRAEWPGKKGLRETKIHRPTLTSEESLHMLCRHVLELCNRGTRFSAAQRIRVLKHLLRFARKASKTIPEPGDSNWRTFIYEHFIFHLSHTEKLRGSDDKSDESLRFEWRGSLVLYKHLKHKGIIPRNIVLPLMKEVGFSGDEGGLDVLDSCEEQLWDLTDPEVLWPKTFLVDKELNITTDKFLENLQYKLTKRSEGIIRACRSYWDKLIYCQAIGASLINSIPTSKIEQVLESGDFYINGKHIADPRNPDGVAWFLSVIDYYFMHTSELKFISYELMKEIPFLRPICSSHKILARMNKQIREIAGEYGVPMTRINETLNRLLGHISARDCAAAAAILIAENPRFTSISLQEANYLSTTDKPVHYYNSDLDCLMWSVSKPRAKTRKASPLTPTSLQIYTDVVRATFKARLHLMRNNNPDYRKLFLTSSFNWVGMNTAINTMFTGPQGFNLYTVLEAELIEAGVFKESFSLKRIRGTQGLIAFLKEGTYQAVATTLGNSIAVVKAHYIPKWLMSRWNIRILRVFQTKLIVLATKNKPWQIEASDFLTKEDLFEFVTTSAIEADTSDPISMELKRYAREITEDAAKFLIEPLLRHKVILNLDPLAFAATFLFAEMHNLAKAGNKQYRDERTGISAESLVTLANLLHATYESCLNNKSCHPIINNITGLSAPSFQRIYTQALKIKSELSQKVSSATASAA